MAVVVGPVLFAPSNTAPRDEPIEGFFGGNRAIFRNDQIMRGDDGRFRDKPPPTNISGKHKPTIPRKSKKNATFGSGQDQSKSESQEPEPEIFNDNVAPTIPNSNIDFSEATIDGNATQFNPTTEEGGRWTHEDQGTWNPIGGMGEEQSRENWTTGAHNPDGESRDLEEMLTRLGQTGEEIDRIIKQYGEAIPEIETEIGEHEDEVEEPQWSWEPSPFIHRLLEELQATNHQVVETLQTNPIDKLTRATVATLQQNQAQTEKIISERLHELTTKIKEGSLEISRHISTAVEEEVERQAEMNRNHQTLLQQIVETQAQQTRLTTQFLATLAESQSKQEQHLNQAFHILQQAHHLHMEGLTSEITQMKQAQTNCQTQTSELRDETSEKLDELRQELQQLKEKHLDDKVEKMLHDIQQQTALGNDEIKEDLQQTKQEQAILQDKTEQLHNHTIVKLNELQEELSSVKEQTKAVALQETMYDLQRQAETRDNEIKEKLQQARDEQVTLKDTTEKLHNQTIEKLENFHKNLQNMNEQTTRNLEEALYNLQKQVEIQDSNLNTDLQQVTQEYAQAQNEAITKLQTLHEELQKMKELREEHMDSRLGELTQALQQHAENRNTIDIRNTERITALETLLYTMRTEITGTVQALNMNIGLHNQLHAPITSPAPELEKLREEIQEMIAKIDRGLQKLPINTISEKTLDEISQEIKALKAIHEATPRQLLTFPQFQQFKLELEDKQTKVTELGTQKLLERITELLQLLHAALENSHTKGQERLLETLERLNDKVDHQAAPLKLEQKFLETQQEQLYAAIHKSQEIIEDKLRRQAEFLEETARKANEEVRRLGQQITDVPKDHNPDNEREILNMLQEIHQQITKTAQSKRSADENREPTQRRIPNEAPEPQARQDQTSRPVEVTQEVHVNITAEQNITNVQFVTRDQSINPVEDKTMQEENTRAAKRVSTASQTATPSEARKKKTNKPAKKASTDARRTSPPGDEPQKKDEAQPRDDPEPPDPNPKNTSSQDNQQDISTEEMKARIIAALQIPSDKATRKVLQELREMTIYDMQPRRKSIHQNILQLLLTTPPSEWPLLHEYTCPVCSRRLETHSQLVLHMTRRHEMVERDFTMRMMEHLLEDEIHCYECQDKHKREICYTHHCGYPDCTFRSNDYNKVWDHRTEKHRWGLRLEALGPFWARLKEEIRINEDVDLLPTVDELLGYDIRHRCSQCPYTRKSQQEVEEHEQEEHDIANPHTIQISREYKLESEVQNEALLEMQDPGERIDEAELYAKARPTLDTMGWNRGLYDLERKEREKSLYTKILKATNIEACALMLTDIKRWRTETDEPLHPHVDMQSDIVSLLKACPPSYTPLVQGHKECHICHKTYQYTEQLKSHIRIAHNAEYRSNPLQRYIEHLTGRKIVSLRVNVCHDCDSETCYPHICPAPTCTFRTHDSNKLHQHLALQSDPVHPRTVKLIAKLGDFWGPIKAYVEKHERLPTIEDLLGYTHKAYKLCKQCGAPVNDKNLDSHMRTHDIAFWDAPQNVDTVKFWPAFIGDKLERNKVIKEVREALWSGTRADVERITDQVYARAMTTQDEPPDEAPVHIDITKIQYRDSATEEDQSTNRQQQVEEPIQDPDHQEAPQHEEESNANDDLITNGVPFGESTDSEDNNSATPIEIEEQESQQTDDTIEGTTFSDDPLPELDTEDDNALLFALTEQEKQLLKILLGNDSLNDITERIERIIDHDEHPVDHDESIISQMNRYNFRELKAGYQCHVCNKHETSEAGLFTHMKSRHSIQGTDWFLMCLRQFTRHTYKVEIQPNDEQFHHEELQEVSKCWMPQCPFIQANKGGLQQHIQRQHDTYHQEIQQYGIIMATLRAHLRDNPNITWSQLLKQQTCHTCTCGVSFGTETSISKHWAQSHNKRTVGNWRAQASESTLRVHISRGQEEPQSNEARPFTHTRRNRGNEGERVTGEAREQLPPVPRAQPPPMPREQRPPVSRNEPARPPPHPNAQPQPQEIEAHNINDQPYWLQRRQELRELTDNGIKMQAILPKHLKNMREGIHALFSEELTPLLVSNDTWEVFEGKYMETIHRMREHITIKQGRDPQKIYTYKAPNPDVNNMILKALQQQKVETKLHRALHYIDKLIQNEGDDVRQGRKRITYMNKLAQVLHTYSPERATELMNELQGNPDHRIRALEWLRVEITNIYTERINCEHRKTTTKTIREEYQENAGTTFRRYIDSNTLPTCNLELQDIEQHYARIWAKELTPPPVVLPEHVSKQLPTDFSDEIVEYITNEDNIKAVVKTRNKLSALGPDGIGYRLYQLGGKQAIKYLKTLFLKVLTEKQIPQDWLQARTILLYKKGDETEINNWRPISITCCTYRIFTALIARAIQHLNDQEQFLTRTQKGFIRKCNGCTEHSILLNELMAHTRRTKGDLIATTIDCTNAFGSVPHNLIFEVMKTMNIPSVIQAIVHRMYEGASTKITTARGTTNKISWRRGVKQGCPLSPLLFNFCLEPLLHTLESHHRQDGVVIANHAIQAQAYADDIVLLSQTVQGMKFLINTTENFMKWSQMQINPAKCTCASYLMNDQRRRCSLEKLYINNQEIQCLTLAESTRYLGSPLASNSRTRMKANEIHVKETEVLLEKVKASRLTINQKLHALKTFVIPHLDFRFLNTEMQRKSISNLDKKIRASVNEMMHIKGLPIANIHASWRDGGLSVPALQDRQDVLCIRAFQQMHDSNDPTVRDLFRMMIASEQKAREVPIQENGTFLNWANHDKNERKGNTCLIARTRKVAERRNINIKVTEDDTIELQMDGKTFKNNHKEKNTLGKFLTSRIRERYKEERKQLPSTCDRLIEATANPDSNYLIHGTRPYNNALVRFMIAGRHNLLPTVANIEKWYNKPRVPCNCGCKGCEIQSLSHLMNSCGYQRAKIIQRHDKIVNVTKEFIATITTDAALLAENTRVPERTEKPDLVIEMANQIVILDVTCPYGGSRENERACERAYQNKVTKYENIRSFLSTEHEKNAIIVPIVVTSFGIVYKKSIQLISTVFKVEEKKLKAYTKQISYAALQGSFEIWRAHIQNQLENNQNSDEIIEDFLIGDDTEEGVGAEEEEPFEEEPLPLDEEIENLADFTENSQILEENIEALFHPREENRVIAGTRLTREASSIEG